MGRYPDARGRARDPLGGGTVPGASPGGRDLAGPASAAFALLTELAARRERIAYSDFAFELGLGSPRSLGWLLSPMLDWCRSRDLPWLPIIVVQRKDGWPSGGYDKAAVAPETERVFGHDWSATPLPVAEELMAFALPPKPVRRRPRAVSFRGSPAC